jgi:glycogen synthase
VKILFVSQEMPPETGWGGIGTYVGLISEALAAKGVEVHVLSIVDDQPSTTKTVGAVTVHRRTVPRVRGSGRFPPESWRRLWLAATVARMVPGLMLDPTVIECPEWMAEGLALGFQRKWPLVVRLHSSARQLFPYTGQGTAWRGLDGRFASRVEEAAARRANVVVSTASNLSEVRTRLGFADAAVREISYPVRPLTPSPMPDPESPRVTFLGRFEPRKAPEVVLGAVPHVLAEIPAARFGFVGRDAIEPSSPSSSGGLQREAERLGVAHAVEIHDAFGRQAVERELRRTTVFVSPSRWESFGYVVAEAQTVSRPVVVSSIPPFRDLVQDGVTGHIVPDDNGRSWASALIELLRDHSRAVEMGRAGAARIAAITDPGHVADLALEAYEHAIERWRDGRRATRR